MADTDVAVQRPQRWDAPLDPGMRDAEIDRLLAIEPFSSIDPQTFPAMLSPRDILRNDTRVARFAPGEIIVREGDYGHSAFFVLSGRCRVLLTALPPAVLGRPTARKLGWLATLLKVARRSRLPEVRDFPLATSTTTHGQDAPIANDDRQSTRIFLQDFPRPLDADNSLLLEPGEIFGELAAMTRSPRTATVLAETDAMLLEIRWQGLRDLMRRSDALRRHIEQLYRENSLRVHLRETPFLAGLPPERLAAIADATVFETHGEFDWHDAFQMAIKRREGDGLLDEPLIVEEGTPADGVMLIRSGFARVSQRHGHGHRTIAYLGRGQNFGWDEACVAAAHGEAAAWSHSLRALGYVDILRIPQRALEELVFPFVDSSHVAPPRGKNPDVATADNGPRAITAHAEPVLAQPLLEFLVDHRLINGQQAMVIDLDRCTRCDDCVRACAATHDNNPRFVRQGRRHGPLMIAQACMHCVDPVCMIGCPTGAIARDAATGIVRINDRTCIGCGVCAQGCPYDNIQMVEIRDRRGKPLVDALSQQPLTMAARCDLCADLAGGPACQRACPHDALIRMDLGNLGEIAEWMARK